MEEFVTKIIRHSRGLTHKEQLKIFIDLVEDYPNIKDELIKREGITIYNKHKEGNLEITEIPKDPLSHEVTSEVSQSVHIISEFNNFLTSVHRLFLDQHMLNSYRKSYKSTSFLKQHFSRYLSKQDSIDLYDTITNSSNLCLNILANTSIGGINIFDPLDGKRVKLNLIGNVLNNVLINKVKIIHEGIGECGGYGPLGMNAPETLFIKKLNEALRGVNLTTAAILCKSNSVVILKSPTKVKTNALGILHSTEETALEFGNDTKYIVNNTIIPRALFNMVRDKKISLIDIARIANEEVKSEMFNLCTEMHGSNYTASILKEFLMKVDSYTHKSKEEYREGTTGGMNIGNYTLFKGVISMDRLDKYVRDKNYTSSQAYLDLHALSERTVFLGRRARPSGNLQIAYVRCYCPSTDRMFYLGVHPKYNHAKEAIASLYQVPKKLKDHIKYIQRQGERFSTVFTNKGMGIMENMSKEEFLDLVSISGDQYFDLMRYEY